MLKRPLRSNAPTLYLSGAAKAIAFAPSEDWWFFAPFATLLYDLRG
jgi:hypothetical protein